MAGITDNTPEITEWPGHPIVEWQAEVAAEETYQSYRDWAREREQGRTDEEADTLVSCRNCSQTLDGTEDSECPEPGSNTYEDGDDEDEDTSHVPDIEVYAVPANDPTRCIAVAFALRVPNDGYNYMSDIGGRLERVMGRMLEDRLVTSVSTRGPSGSGYEGDVEDKFAPRPEPEPEDTPEAVVARWRAANKDDAANHTYAGPQEPDAEGNPPKCTECGDDPAGLLHAFDESFPAGYHDEAIYEVQARIEAEARAA